MREEKKKYNKDKYADFERDEDFMDKPKDSQVPDNLEDEDEEDAKSSSELNARKEAEPKRGCCTPRSIYENRILGLNGY